MPWTAIRWSAAVLILLICTITDLRERRIPNGTVLVGAVAGVLLSIASDRSEALTRFLLPALGYAALFGYFASRKWMGVGDVKLIVVLVTIVGGYAALYALFYGFLLGAGWTLAVMAWKGQLGGLWRRSGQEGSLRPSIPLAPFLLVGAIVTWIRMGR